MSPQEPTPPAQSSRRPSSASFFTNAVVKLCSASPTNKRPSCNTSAEQVGGGYTATTPLVAAKVDFEAAAPAKAEAAPIEFVLDADSDNKRLEIDQFYDRDANQMLGDGQWGVVYKGKDKTTGKSCAIKCISKAHCLKHMKAEQLREEVSILGTLEHPAIVRLHNAFEDAANVYLVMESLLGGELFDLLEEVGIFPEKQTLLIMRQVLASLSYVHNKSICHRDIKAENFLFMYPRSRGVEANVLKLIDFSYAKRFTFGQRLHTFMGSPDYVSPQVIQKDYDQACDVWSVGVLMYCLLCGYMPFRGSTDHDTLQLISECRIEFPAKAWDSISSQAKTMVRHLMHPDDQVRWSADRALIHSWDSKKVGLMMSAQTALDDESLRGPESNDGNSEQKTVADDLQIAK